jgi:hypothetical protein
MKSPKTIYKFIFSVRYYSREKLSRLTISTTNVSRSNAYDRAYKQAKKILNDVDLVELDSVKTI